MSREDEANGRVIRFQCQVIRKKDEVIREKDEMIRENEEVIREKDEDILDLTGRLSDIRGCVERVWDSFGDLDSTATAEALADIEAAARITRRT